MAKHSIWYEVVEARKKAHVKHGENSIEAIPADRVAVWLPILIEEVGELANALTYDSTGDPRAELIDVLAVASAWVDAMDGKP